MSNARTRVITIIAASVLTLSGWSAVAQEPDLAEEFRAPIADRACLTLLNRRQLGASDFRHEETGAVFLREEARKAVLTAWQERKRTTVTHPFLSEKMPLGIVPHVQAQLLARHLRGDLDGYPAYVWR